jgi:hypothetical protein
VREETPSRSEKAPKTRFERLSIHDQRIISGQKHHVSHGKFLISDGKHTIQKQKMSHFSWETQ